MMNEKIKEVTITIAIVVFVAVVAFWSGTAYESAVSSRSQFRLGIDTARDEVDSAIWELRVNEDIDGNRDIRIDTLQTFADRFKGKIHDYQTFPDHAVVIVNGIKDAAEAANRYQRTKEELEKEAIAHPEKCRRGKDGSLACGFLWPDNAEGKPEGKQ